MRYVKERYIEYMREKTYRIYVSDSLQLAPQGKCKTKRYADYLLPPKTETRDGGEIADEIMKKHGLRFKE